MNWTSGLQKSKKKWFSTAIETVAPGGHEPSLKANPAFPLTQLCSFLCSPCVSYISCVLLTHNFGFLYLCVHITKGNRLHNGPPRCLYPNPRNLQRLLYMVKETSQMWLDSGLGNGEIVLDCSSGSHIITGIFIRGRRRSERQTMEAESWRCLQYWLQRCQWTKECQVCNSGIRKRQGNRFFPRPSKSHTVLWTSLF